jgi:hypothetical protein
MGTEFFKGVDCGQGVLLIAHPLLVPRSWKIRAIPLPTGPVRGKLYLLPFISLAKFYVSIGVDDESSNLERCAMTSGK